MSALGHQISSNKSEPTPTNILLFVLAVLAWLTVSIGARFAAALEETQHLNRAGTTVRVMTWNIHSGVGTDGRFDLTRVVKTIGAIPDVVALQEVDSRQTLAPARSAFAVLRDAVGEHGIEAKSIITADGAYGQMVVSRWPLAQLKSTISPMPSVNRAALSRSRSQRPPGHSG